MDAMKELVRQVAAHHAGRRRGNEGSMGKRDAMKELVQQVIALTERNEELESIVASQRKLIEAYDSVASDGFDGWMKLTLNVDAVIQFLQESIMVPADQLAEAEALVESLDGAGKGAPKQTTIDPVDGSEMEIDCGV